jgi:hypothetical protein
MRQLPQALGFAAVLVLASMHEAHASHGRESELAVELRLPSRSAMHQGNGKPALHDER